MDKTALASNTLQLHHILLEVTNVFSCQRFINLCRPAINLIHYHAAHAVDSHTPLSFFRDVIDTRRTRQLQQNTRKYSLCIQLWTYDHCIDSLSNDVCRCERDINFCSNVLWRTVLNALLKSGDFTMTYGLPSKWCVTECRMDTIAPVVEPVGLKANWSDREGWMQELSDHSFFHDPSQNRGNGDRTKVSELLRHINLGDRSNAGLIPQFWHYCSFNR